MKLIDVRKTYHNQSNDVVALKGINLEIDHCGITMILGPSGCGKTTLLNIIAQKESYEGEIQDVPSFDYLTQDFQLFEQMSVYDNLSLVLNDEKKIDGYLKEFSLFDKKKDKVKKLSNGEKKRVQFIRALLHQPGLLLCDEPTAALDHENTVLLMEELKKVSKDVQILMVTHDIAIAEEYGDRIIMLDQGIISKDEILHASSPCQKKGSKLVKKTGKDTLRVVWKEITSQISDSLVSIILLVLSIVTLFTIFNLNANIKGQADYLKSFKNCKNMVVSVEKELPKDLSDDDGGSYKGIREDDLFSYDEILGLIEQTPEIIGVQAWRDGSNTFLWYLNQVEDQKAFESFAKIHSSYDGGDMILYNFPQTQIFLVPKNYQPIDQREFSEAIYEKSMLSEDEATIACFDLVNQYEEIPLLCGEFPKEDEILLCKDTADFVNQMYGFESYEDLVGKKINLLATPVIGLYEKEDIKPFNVKDQCNSLGEAIPITVSGVSQIENKYAHIAFFGNGFAKNPFYQHFVKDLHHYRTDKLQILLKPGSDYEALAKKINTYFSKPRNTMKVFEGKGFGVEQEFYESPTGFMTYALMIFAILVVILVLQIVFKKKKFIKEKTILKNYGYGITTEVFLRYFILSIVSWIITVIFASNITQAINAYAQANHYQPFMNMDMLMVLAMSVGMWIFMVVLEMILIPNRKIK